MKISYNWLKNYVSTDLPAEEVARLLTDAGLEVESVEKHESVKGGLEGIVIGEVKTCAKHPGADRLSVTTVDVGQGEPLHIVCGAPNVAAGQKVVVALVGAKLYPSEGEPFEIKKSKIRGEASEGMICAEDEIGLGTSHAGIMVLNEDAKVGTPAKQYFKLEEDHILEIGLTPNRADAASHIGVARDLVAILQNAGQEAKLDLPSVNEFETTNNDKQIDVVIEDAKACPRYSGVTISGVTVKESPAWLKNRLLSIGLRPINNVVDVTNFVLHELGQPLHAFDADKITGNKVIVKKLAKGTKFLTLDGVERELSGEDLMICNGNQEGMCIAGVFGGAKSGVTEETKNIFLESAYFNSVTIRKTSRYHGLKTDASFRFERGTDPNITVYALQRAALLIAGVAGGKLSSEVVDVYPNPVEPFIVPFSYKNCDRLVGKHIERSKIRKIITSLGIEVRNEGSEGMQLAVPPYKVDVHREVDVIEEVLRIYGYNNIEDPSSLRSSISYAPNPDKEQLQNTVSDLLSYSGFNELMSLSLTKGDYVANMSSFNRENNVNILNPLSSDLNVLRQTLLFSGLEAIVYNQNRKSSDLRLYEFGNVYKYHEGADKPYFENQRLALFTTGRKHPESWNTKSEEEDFYRLKGYVQNVLARLGLTSLKLEELQPNDIFSGGLAYDKGKNRIVEFGKVSRALLKRMDISQDVYFADMDWDAVIRLAAGNKVQYREVSKFPAVRRDLALMLNREVKFRDIEQLAYQSERNLLKEVNLFDVYEGDKLEKGKKSYAVSFILQDENATLTDKQIEKIMEKLTKTFSEKLGATLRG
jgi:phenylalanyl-tRNA synthetase beta chain